MNEQQSKISLMAGSSKEPDFACEAPTNNIQLRHHVDLSGIMMQNQSSGRETDRQTN